MRSDRDKRTDSEREIDDFLAQFETPVDELSADINSYLDTTDTTKMTAARTFYGAEFKNTGSSDPASVSDVSGAESAASPAAADIADNSNVSPVLSEGDQISAGGETSDRKARKPSAGPTIFR